MHYAWIAIVILLLIIAPCASAQDEYHVYFGNIDESPYPVPARDTVDIPVYVSGSRIGSGTITLYAWNLYISERLGGNFYLNGSYNFAAPQYFEEYSRQTLSFAPSTWGEGIFRLADFTFLMDADSTYYGDEVIAIDAPTVMFVDLSGQNFYFPLVHISPFLIQETDNIEIPDPIPGSFAMYDAYPNPFNSSTTIRFTLPEVSDVAIEFYDISGRQVRSLNIPGCLAGENHATWDGRDNGGDPVSSATYIYRLTAGKLSNFSRVTLLK
jgi:hypothetical protein